MDRRDVLSRRFACMARKAMSKPPSGVRVHADPQIRAPENLNHHRVLVFMPTHKQERPSKERARATPRRHVNSHGLVVTKAICTPAERVRTGCRDTS